MSQTSVTRLVRIRRHTAGPRPAITPYAQAGTGPRAQRSPYDGATTRARSRRGKGDPQAHTAIWERYALVRRMPSRAIGPSDDVDDQVPEVFLRFYCNRTSLDPAALRGALLGITFYTRVSPSRRTRRWMLLTRPGRWISTALPIGLKRGWPCLPSCDPRSARQEKPSRVRASLRQKGADWRRSRPPRRVARHGEATALARRSACSRVRAPTSRWRRSQVARADRSARRGRQARLGSARDGTAQAAAPPSRKRRGA